LRMNCVRTLKRLLAATTLFATLSVPLTAQDTSTAGQNDSGRCWRGRPAPACKSIVLTELGIYRDVVTPGPVVRFVGPNGEIRQEDPARDSRADFQIELGVLKNVSTKTAIGASILGRGTDEGDGYIGMKGRYRRWLTQEGVALDVGLGVRTNRDPASVGSRPPSPGYSTGKRGPALTSDVAFNYKDYGSLVTRFDLAKFGDRTEPNVSIGVRGGSRVATFGLAGILGAVVLIASVAVVAN
jgi:hypothetical protein